MQHVRRKKELTFTSGKKIVTLYNRCEMWVLTVAKQQRMGGVQYIAIIRQATSVTSALHTSQDSKAVLRPAVNCEVSKEEPLYQSEVKRKRT